MRRSIPIRLASICEIASASSSGVHGPAGNPSLPSGRPAPAAAVRLNNSLKSLPSFGGGRKNFPLFNKDLVARVSFRFARFRILSCLRSQIEACSPRNRSHDYAGCFRSTVICFDEPPSTDHAARRGTWQPIVFSRGPTRVWKFETVSLLWNEIWASLCVVRQSWSPARRAA